MKDKDLEQFVEAIERAFVSAGAKDFEDGVRIAKKLIGFFYEGVQSIETKQDFIRAIAQCPPSMIGELDKGLLLVKNLPGVVRHLLIRLARMAASSFSPLPSGRPVVIPPRLGPEILDFIATLNRKGCSLTIAKDRAAKKYDVSRRTIDRLWSDRASYAGDVAPAKVTMADALEYLFTGK
jgi:hypothetical protein